MARKNYYLDDDLIKRLESTAAIEDTTMSLIVEKALRLYFDTHYMEHYASTIPQDIIKAFNAQASLMESRLNSKSNKLLSELAIQVGILQMVVANSLEASPDFVEKARIRMIEYLKTNNRVFRMEQMLDDVGD